MKTFLPSWMKEFMINRMFPVAITATPNKEQFARRVCGLLKIEYVDCPATEFGDGERFFKFKENVRGKRLFIITSTEQPDNNWMNALFIADNAKLASAYQVTILFTYFGYSRADRKDSPRKNIASATLVKLVKAVNVDRVIILDPHFSQLQSMFAAVNINCELLFGTKIFSEYIIKQQFRNLIVSSVDAGGQKILRAYSSHLGVPCIVFLKDRVGTDEISLIGSASEKLSGKIVVIADDLTTTLSSVNAVAKKAKELGASKVHAAITHFVATEKNSSSLLDALDSSAVDRLFVTNSIEWPEGVMSNKKIAVVDLEDFICKVIRNTYYEKSISQLFVSQNGH